MTTFKSNEIEEFFTKAQLISKESSEKNTYSKFVSKFQKIKELIKLFNSMVKIGKIPDEELLESIDLSSMKGKSSTEIELKIKKLKEDYKKWNDKIKNMMKNITINDYEDYYISFFLGKNLIKINNRNVWHYIQFIESEIELKKLEGSSGKLYFL